MLILAGPGIANLQYYSGKIDAGSIQVQENQGDTLNTLSCTLYDPTSTATINDDDDFIFCDEMDPDGFPVVNLVKNPSFEGAYSAGIANSWSGFQTGLTGVTVSSSATAQFGSLAQQMTVANVATGKAISLNQLVVLPTDENLAVLRALPYYFSIYLRVTVALAGVSGTIFIGWYSDLAGSTLISQSISTAFSSGVSGYTRYTTTGTAPTNAVAVRVSIQLFTNSGTNSGTLLIDGAQLEYATCAQAMVNATQTALQAGKYPTPYCDNAQAGCFTDTGRSGLFYRQLRLFGGFPKTIEEDYGAGPSRNLVCSVTEYGILLQEAQVNIIVNSQTDTSAIAAAATYAKANGTLVGLDTTTYVSTIGTISGQAFSWTTFRDVMNNIANQTQGAYYVDPYLFLHYQSNLALSAPYALSQTPDMVTTFPFDTFTRTQDSTQALTYHIVEGGSQLSGPQPYSATGNGVQIIFTVNGGNPIETVDSVTVGGVAQLIGLASINTLGVGGIQVVYDPTTGNLTFNTAPGNTVTVAIVFRFESPIMVVVQNPKAEAPTGSARRRIQDHQKYDAITTVQSGIDRAKTELSMAATPQKVATLTIRIPPCPVAVPIRAGMAIAITYNPASLASALFQVQQVTTTVAGNGYVQRDLTLGVYRPDLQALIAQAAREAAQSGTDQSAGATIVDATFVSDGWSLTDSVAMPTVSNIGGWAPPTNGTWSGTNVWG